MQLFIVSILKQFSNSLKKINDEMMHHFIMSSLDIVSCHFRGP
jgi:hypothetical protein